jgi:hypothetical protein
MKKLFKILSIGLALSQSNSFAQIDTFDYKRQIQGTPNVWNKIELPDDIFEKTDPSLQDIRIYGINKTKDTLETPYILKINDHTTDYTQIGYYYTLSIPGKELLNFLQLNFTETNFDWKIDLEGSQDQTEWFMLLKEYRILAINNGQTNFSYTDLSFPTSSYAYLRLHIHSQSPVSLISAKVLKNEPKTLNYKSYLITKKSRLEDKSSKSTEISFELKYKVPVSQLRLEVKEQYSYYRPITIQYLTDSVQTPKGWYYNYQTISQSVLSSELSNTYKLDPIIAKKFKVIIYIIARITDKADYLLCYGSQTMGQAIYDIARTEVLIPDSLAVLTLGTESKTNKITSLKTEAMMQNMAWLWAIMGVVVVILAFFSYKMLKK